MHDIPMEPLGAAPLESIPGFRLELVYDRPLVYDSQAGQRGFFRIVEGVVSGARLNGRIVDDGGDWIVFRPDGLVETDSRMMIEAEDGTVIYLRSRGVLRAGAEKRAGYLAGRGLDAGGAYYRTAPYFDTPVGPHDWLTKTLFVGTGSFAGDRATLDIHEIL